VNEDGASSAAVRPREAVKARLNAVGRAVVSETPRHGLAPRNHEVDPPAAALAEDQPPVPVGDGHLGAVALGHLGRVELDLMPAVETLHDQPHVRRSGVAQGHRRAAVGVRFVVARRLYPQCDKTRTSRL
jgi:hypothetical protein